MLCVKPFADLRCTHLKELTRVQREMRVDFAHMLQVRLRGPTTCFTPPTHPTNQPCLLLCPFADVPQMYTAAQAAGSERQLEIWLQAAAELGASPVEMGRARNGGGSL